MLHRVVDEMDADATTLLSRTGRSSGFATPSAASLSNMSVCPPNNPRAFQHLTAFSQALVEAELMVRYRSIRTSTVGIVFLATPHRGSSVANFGSIVASVVNLVTPGMRVFNDTLRDLKKGSSALFETSSKFANICAGISIHTFYETGGGPLVICVPQLPHFVVLVKLLT